MTSITLDVGQVWDAAGWSYRRKLSLSSVAAANHVLLVTLNEDNFDYGRARSDGGDFRFYDNYGTELSYALKIWDTADQSTLIVQVAAADTSAVYMYYGKADATDQSDANLAAMELIDSDFEHSNDFVGNFTEFWEKKAGGSNPWWTVAIADEDAHHNHVKIYGDTNSRRGSRYFAQEFQVPANLTSASFSLDYMTYCSDGDRGGIVGISLMTLEFWDAVPVDNFEDSRTPLWREYLHLLGEGDVTSWTTESTTDNANLLTALQGYAGQKMMAVIHWTGAHDNAVEWAKFDNFVLTATSSPEVTVTMEREQKSGETALSTSTVYYWHVQYQDSANTWSAWSDETSFTTLNP